ncbi:hypothetical protein [Maribacter sp. 2307ULW6-5]|uniref:hypothetical protein n=1 Tax=Maribacter sp. 2307ULW6-5 TaxID=3386275 RepID=UPI0039BCAC80
MLTDAHPYRAGERRVRYPGGINEEGQGPEAAPLESASFWDAGKTAQKKPRATHEALGKTNVFKIKLW